MHSVFALFFYLFLCFQHVIAVDLSTYKRLPAAQNRVDVELDQMLASATVDEEELDRSPPSGRKGKSMLGNKGAFSTLQIFEMFKILQLRHPRQPFHLIDKTFHSLFPSTSGNRYIFMAHHKVPSELSDLQLVKIAMDGFMDMLTQGTQYELVHKEMPGVITAFYFDKQIILASSQVGGLSLTYTRGNGIKQLVEDCIGPNKTKSKQAKCGEMSALHIFEHLYPGKSIHGANIVTVTVRCVNSDVSKKEKDIFHCKEEHLEVYPPCDPQENQDNQR